GVMTRVLRLLVATGLFLGAPGARASIDATDGAIVLERNGIVSLQVISSSTGFRNVLSMTPSAGTVTSPPDCGGGANVEKSGGSTISNCVYDTGYCSGMVNPAT